MAIQLPHDALPDLGRFEGGEGVVVVAEKIGGGVESVVKDEGRDEAGEGEESGGQIRGGTLFKVRQNLEQMFLKVKHIAQEVFGVDVFFVLVGVGGDGVVAWNGDVQVALVSNYPFVYDFLNPIQA